MAELTARRKSADVVIEGFNGRRSAYVDVAPEMSELYICVCVCVL